MLYPKARLELLAHAVTLFVERNPFRQFFCCQFAPVFYCHNWQISVEEIEGRGRHNDDMSKSERLPGPVTIESRSMWAENECVCSSFPPHLTSTKQFALAKSYVILPHRFHALPSALVTLPAFQRVTASIATETESLLPAKIYTHLLTRLPERPKTPVNGP